MKRPDIKDYFDKDTTVQQAHEQYASSTSLYNYMQALDTYIDHLESKKIVTTEWIEKAAVNVVRGTFCSPDEAEDLSDDDIINKFQDEWSAAAQCAKDVAEALGYDVLHQANILEDVKASSEVRAELIRIYKEMGCPDIFF